MVRHGLLVILGASAPMAFASLADPMVSQWLPIAAYVAWRVPRARALCLFVAAVLWTTVHAHMTLGALGLPHAARAELELEGCVSGVASQAGRAQRFEFDVHAAGGRQTALASAVRLAWYGRPVKLEPGACYRLRARVSPPRPGLNPGGFDYARWLHARGVAWQGYVRTIDGAMSSTGGGLLRLRLRLADAVRTELGQGSRSAAALIQALALGLRADIDPSTRDVLRRTGTAHLLAVSGLHIGLVATMVYLLCVYALSRCQRRIAAPRAAAVAAGVAALAYSALAGFALPTQRALVISILFFAAVWFRQPVSAWRCIVLCASFIAIADPPSLTSPGLWLSFSAVAIIAYGCAGRGQESWFAQTVRVQCVAAIGMMPIVIVLFGQSPMLGVAANLIAVPVASIALVPGALMSVAFIEIWPAFGGLVMHLTAIALDVLLAFLEWLAHWSLEFEPTAAPGPLTYALAVVGTLILLAPSAVPARWLGIAWMLPLAFGRHDAIAPGVAQATVLNVGQGLSVVVRTQSHTLIYDTGPPMGQSDAGEFVIAPYMRTIGRPHVDVLLVSHTDADHAGGVQSVLNNLSVEEIVGNPGPIARVATPCLEKRPWVWDGVEFKTVAVRREQGEKLTDNNTSCMLLVDAAGQRLLLPGDIEDAGEAKIVQTVGPRLRADVVVAPHHGSSTSSTWAFVDAVQPRFVIYAAGLNNRYGFPHQSVAERYAGVGARAFSTGVGGAISITLGEKVTGLSVATSAGARRFWHRYGVGPWRVFRAPL
jgi:competence protein ComEC